MPRGGWPPCRNARPWRDSSLLWAIPRWCSSCHRAAGWGGLGGLGHGMWALFFAIKIKEYQWISMKWHINGISITMEYQWYIYIYIIYIYMMFGWITVSLALVMVLLFFSCKILDTYHINGVYLHLFTSYFDVKSMAQGFDPSSFFFRRSIYSVSALKAALWC